MQSRCFSTATVSRDFRPSQGCCNCHSSDSRCLAPGHRRSGLHSCSLEHSHSHIASYSGGEGACRGPLVFAAFASLLFHDSASAASGFQEKRHSSVTAGCTASCALRDGLQESLKLHVVSNRRCCLHLLRCFPRSTATVQGCFAAVLCKLRPVSDESGRLKRLSSSGISVS
jgi:hypothetical protein